ncbi:hypothetical protein [Alkalicoccobacillus porphyridii]|uniref:Uncharacterized protein n=1 Tax=Alkalicoccobacillus porphyridii TaxID=2597270 RepID=A0A553ZXX0_9BACI|nr:hypothetical protein [Alkalicoccobacillus porphyridii]TSB46255.1 hypothetical protein FN960_12915 [Alkalicoccobacillus porphyridii]
MDLLEELKQQFGWEKAVAVNEQMIETDSGIKRLRRWEDQGLMDWHIRWRDHCSMAPLVLTDRMIRTKAGEASVPWKSTWVTIHDEIPDPFMQDENGQVWGTFIGLLIQFGVRTEQEMRTQEVEEPDLKQLEKKLWMFPKALQPTLRHVLYEAKARQAKATAIRTRHSSSRLPLVDSTGINQAKEIHGLMFWTGSNDYPHTGYYPICTLLREWMARHDTMSLTPVLDAIENIYSDFSKEQGGLLLAECLIPYEVNQLNALLLDKRTEAEIESTVNACNRDWALSKRMVDEIAEWLDGRHS